MSEWTKKEYPQECLSWDEVHAKNGFGFIRWYRVLRRTNQNIEGDCAKKDNLFLYIKSGECHNADRRGRACSVQAGREGGRFPHVSAKL